MKNSFNCNPQTRTVYVQLDRERALRYTTNGICEAERLGGFSIGEILEEGLSAKINFSRIRLLLYALLSHEDPAITLERIGEIIDNTPDKKAIFDAMGLALSLGMAVDPEKSYTDWVAAEELAARIAALKKRAEAGDADAELELQELYEELDEKEAGKKK